MKKDIEGREDLEQLIAVFYDAVVKDDEIGFIFTDIVKMNWDKHLPLMCDFWENALFYSGGYSGNPMNLHKHLHYIRPLDHKHFARWVSLFTATVDRLFKGDNAKLAKQKAAGIASVMESKILEYRKEYQGQ